MICALRLRPHFLSSPKGGVEWSKMEKRIKEGQQAMKELDKLKNDLKMENYKETDWRGC